MDDPARDQPEQVGAWRYDARRFVGELIDRAARLIVAAALDHGRRSTLYWIGDALFLAVADELAARGLPQSVGADMFGISRRTYLRKLRAAREAVAHPESLWLRLVRHLTRGPATREELSAAFAAVHPILLASLLADLTRSGWVVRRDDGRYEGRPRDGGFGDAALDELLWVLRAADAPELTDIATRFGIEPERLAELRDADPVVIDTTDGNRWAVMTEAMRIALDVIGDRLTGQPRDDATHGAWASVPIASTDRARADRLTARSHQVRQDLLAYTQTETVESQQVVGEEPPAWRWRFLYVAQLEPQDV